MASPFRVTVRPYQVGFGDCFLLTFHYKRGGDRHVLIDFGSTAEPRGFKDLTMAVAKSIREECGGKLHAVVATHRHKDHISGFATNSKGTGPGDLIAGCRPDVVVQPWTEDPAAQPDAKVATSRARASKAFVGALQDMHVVAASVAKEAMQLAAKTPASLFAAEDEVDAAVVVQNGAATSLPVKRTSPLLKRLAFLGDVNIANLSAIENLIRMGKRRGARAVYVNCGSKSGLESVLPGVKVHVLGPPTLKQSDSIRTQRRVDEAEFWHFQAQASHRAVASSRALFPQAPTLAGAARPKESRWLLRQLRSLRGVQLREIVRILDKAMNNTSVILLFEVGKQLLLFPGDAQIENWQFALSQPKIRKLLERVTFYKVGHHGSLNATPRTLWKGFNKRSKKPTSERLRTVVSTMLGKHGDRAHDTEVPRDTLVAALSSESDFFTTQSIKAKAEKLFEPQILDL